MGYSYQEITSLEALQIPTIINKKDISKYNISVEDYQKHTKFKKADAQIKIIIKIGEILKIENISLKKANSDADYNQIDKRTVDSYQEIWNFSDEVNFWLKLFTGELLPKEIKKRFPKIKPRENNRLFLDEIPEKAKEEIINFFTEKKVMVLSDIIRGRGGLSADWMLVTRINRDDNSTTWSLRNINEVINYYTQGNVHLSPRGSLTIGRVTLQRKGGTPDPTKLQFKFKPCDIFKIG